MSNIKNSQSNPLKCSAPVRPPGGDTAPKKVYVCSPFRPMAASVADKAEEQRSNIERALKACRILAMMGIQPLAPHLYFTRFLKDDVAAERDTGIRFALSWLEQADELWVFGERVSDGMAQEIAKAKELGKPVHTLPEPGRVAELLKLAESLNQKYGEGAVFINKVVINNMDFEEAYNTAIQQKSIAQQNADKQKIENEAAIAKAEADKQVAITNAEAEAQKTSIAADAQAEANRKIAESLSEPLIEYQKIQKWDGKLPTVSGSNALVSIDPAE